MVGAHHWQSPEQPIRVHHRIGYVHRVEIRRAEIRRWGANSADNAPMPKAILATVNRAFVVCAFGVAGVCQAATSVPAPLSRPIAELKPTAIIRLGTTADWVAI